MTSFTTEYNLNGTPSGNRDASRTDTTTASVQSPRATHFEERQDSEKFSETSADITDNDEFEEKTPAPALAPNVSSFKNARPTLGSRQNTAYSITAAAPYGGFYCSDLERAVTAPATDYATTNKVELARTGPDGLSHSQSSSASTLAEIPTALAAASRVSTDVYGNTYPEGGAEAWLCVLGSFSLLFCSLGLMNSISTYVAYLSTHQLAQESESAIGWIFGIYAFLAFFCGIQIGPAFDAMGPRWLVLAGSVLILATYFLIGLATAYWHFMLIFGVCGGLGTSLLFTPAIASVGHFFLRKRGQCTGLAAVGGSFGGIIFPLIMQSLFPKIGFAWTTRVLGLITFLFLIVGNLCIKSRLPKHKVTLEAIMPDFRIFRDPVFALTTLGVFFVEWGLFVPLSYLTSYALAHGVNEAFSYQLIAILNVGSCAGRYFPGLVADKVGRFNAMVVTIAMCLVATLGLWLPAGSSVPLIVVYALVFGFASGSGISLTPVCVGQLCKVENYGRYYATCYTIVSFGSLTGIPIAGQLVTACGGQFWGLIVFTGAAYAASTGTFVAARVLGAGWKVNKKF